MLAEDIDFYQFIVSFMAVYFSGQGCATMFTFASSESDVSPPGTIPPDILTEYRFHKSECRR